MEQKTLKDTFIPKWQMNESAGQALIRKWKLYKKPGTSQILKPGNMVFVSNYEATTVPVWDKNPCLLILNVSKSYVLAFNINWLGRRDREKLIRQFIKAYKGKKPLTRMERVILFNKIRGFKFPRSAYRVYKFEELKTSKIYLLNVGDFFEAITKRLISKIKAPKSP